MIAALGRWLMGRRRTQTGCRACGICCELYGHTISASPEDLTRWKAEGRSDLLCEVGEEGTLWIEVATGERMQECPHFVRLDPDSARCGIHATKPEMCRAYPTSVHGHRCVRGFRFTGP